MINFAKALIEPCDICPDADDLSLTFDNSNVYHNLIVTRYYLDFYSPVNSNIDIDKWFHSRNSLFKKFTYPAIKGQTIQNYTWIIFIEKRCIHLLPECLQGENIDPFIRIIELESSLIGGSTVSKMVNEEIENYFSTNSKVDSPRAVTVTRIDNDDALAIDYFETLNRAVWLWFNSTKDLSANPIITFPFGIQATPDGECSAYIFNNNHFLNSIHQPDSHKINSTNACTHNHSLIFSRNEFILLLNTNKPMWMELIHGQNISNWFRDDHLLNLNEKLKARFPWI